jgi:hypothetical protein
MAKGMAVKALRATVRALPLLVFAALVALAFVQSFAALRDVAASSGAVDAQLAWITPLIIDGTIVAASAVAWSRALDGDHHRPALVVIAIFGAVSIGANMLHADPTWVARGIASLPPVALLVCVELAMAEVRRWAREPEAVAAPAVAVATDAVEVFDADQLIATPTDMRRTARVRATVEAWLHGGGNLDTPGLKQAIAARTGAHTRTVERVLGEHRADHAGTAAPAVT